MLRVQTAAHSECVTVQICRKLSFINLFQFENNLSVNGKAAFKHKVNTILIYIYIFLKDILWQDPSGLQFGFGVG